jgi:hypothetical protein
MVMSVPDFFRHNPEAEADVRNAAAFLVSIQTRWSPVWNQFN